MYELTRIVASSDCGGDRKMTLGALLELISDCELFQIESDPFLTDYLTKNGFVMYLGSRQADITRLPAYGESVKAVTSIYEMQGAYGYRNTFVYGADGAPLVRSYGMGLLVDRKANKLAKAPHDSFAAYRYDKKLEMDYLPRRIDLAGPARTEPPFAVPRAYIDLYDHVNNTRYVTAAAEYLPAAAKISRLRVEYKNAARYGDVIHAAVYTPPAKTIVELKSPDDKPYAIVEFTH